MSIKLFSPEVQKEVINIREGLIFIQKRWPQKITLRDNEEISIYDCHPYLFIQAFQELKFEDVQDLSLAARLFSSLVCLNDQLIDCKAIPKTFAVKTLRAVAIQAEAYQLLNKIFPKNIFFWECLQNNIVDYINACLCEKEFALAERPWAEYSEVEAIQIIMGKNGLAKTTIAGLVELSGNSYPFQYLTKSINHFNIAYQIWDDLQDWKEDWREQIPSILLSRITQDRPSYFDENELKEQIQQVSQEVYYGGHAEYVLELALLNLNHSDDLTSEFTELGWHQIIEGLRQRCQDLLNEIREIVSKNRQNLCIK
jgi:squalene-hopene/tetraprenyl-beta-curcumene cyclase